MTNRAGSSSKSLSPPLSTVKPKWRMPRIKPHSFEAQIISDILGVSEVDIRDYQVYVDRDAYKIRLWNHRKLDVSGLQMYQHMEHVLRHHKQRIQSNAQ